MQYPSIYSYKVSSEKKNLGIEAWDLTQQDVLAQYAQGPMFHVWHPPHTHTWFLLKTPCDVLAAELQLKQVPFKRYLVLSGSFMSHQHTKGSSFPFSISQILTSLGKST